MSDQIEIGKTMFNSALVVARAWKEANDMAGELEKLFQEHLFDAGIVRSPGGISYGDGENDSSMDPGGWVYWRWAYTYGLTKQGPGKRKPFGWLTIEIVMAEEEAISCGIEEAFVNVLFAEDAWSAGEFVFPPSGTLNYLKESEEDEDSNYQCEILNQGVWWFSWDGIEQPCWVFSVPLAALNSIEDLTKQIVVPVVGLLNINSTDPDMNKVEKAIRNADKLMRFKGGNDNCSRIFT